MNMESDAWHEVPNASVLRSGGIGLGVFVVGLGALLFFLFELLVTWQNVWRWEPRLVWAGVAALWCGLLLLVVPRLAAAFDRFLTHSRVSGSDRTDSSYDSDCFRG